MKQWIILLVKGGRVASLEFTPDTLKGLQQRMYLSLVAVNADGTRGA
jgi:hypothetical protein